MAYVLTNGKYYIKMTDTGAVAKSDKIDDARVFLTADKAKERLQKAPGKTKGYYIFDLETQAKYIVQNGRIKFPKEVRKMIYHNADGRCVLCGRKITYNNMTMDHIKPLAMGGEDSVENLQCTCSACNLFKGSVLPEDFLDRVSEIYQYQMEKKHGNSLKWKMAHWIIKQI